MLFKNRVPCLVDEVEQNEKEKNPQLFPPGTAHSWQWGELVRDNHLEYRLVRTSPNQ